MFKYIFGPVPSRRLGMSLGVDLIPLKTCSLDCVYCEIGKTTHLTVKRREYVNIKDITEELTTYFEQNPDPDYITFAGSGEPTLNINIKRIINFTKSIKPNIPIAVLTNGTLLYDKNVRDSILQAELVLPSLDAATQKTFNKINRPHKEIKIENYIQGLINFRQEFRSQIHLEVFILPGYNDHEEELMQIRKAIRRICPDEVHLNTLDRPGILPNLRRASIEELDRIRTLWSLNNVEIIASAKQRENITAYRKDIDSAILETLARRPCTLDDLIMILCLHASEINKYLGTLEENGNIEIVYLPRGAFYQIKK
jgi:wyosine [tRNA(Phe)-imidazoG37] synthetase (radical SAM superfamily)